MFQGGSYTLIKANIIICKPVNRKYRHKGTPVIRQDHSHKMLSKFSFLESGTALVMCFLDEQHAAKGAFQTRS